MLKIAFAGLGDHALQSHVWHLAYDPAQIKKAPDLRTVMEMEPLKRKLFLDRFDPHPDVRLVAGFDPKKSAFRNLSDNMGVSLTAYTDLANGYDAMLDKEDINAVLISSPDAAHLPQLRAAVGKGLHVFCEKPLCTSASEVGELKDILDRAAQNGQVVTSCHPRRFDQPYLWLKKNLPSLRGEFGRVMHVGLEFSYHKPSAKKRALHGESLLQDHVNHEIDYLNFLLGHEGFDAYKLLDAHDRYHLAGARQDGITFDFHGTRRLNGSIYPESIDVRFERGEAHIDTYNTNNSFITDHEKNCTIAIPRAGTTDYMSRFATINKNWVDAMLGRRNNYLDQRDLVLNSALSVGLHGTRHFEYRIVKAEPA